MGVVEVEGTNVRNAEGKLVMTMSRMAGNVSQTAKCRRRGHIRDVKD